jgi:hypothetical protein
MCQALGSGDELDKSPCSRETWQEKVSNQSRSQIIKKKYATSVFSDNHIHVLEVLDCISINGSVKNYFSRYILCTYHQLGTVVDSDLQWSLSCCSGATERKCCSSSTFCC